MVEHGCVARRTSVLEQVSAESCKLLKQAPEQYRTCCPMFLIFKVRNMTRSRPCPAHQDHNLRHMSHVHSVSQDGWVKEDIRQPNFVAVRKAIRRLLDPPPSIEDIEPPQVCLALQNTDVKCTASIVS